jgi:hypothetical protein
MRRPVSFSAARCAQATSENGANAMSTRRRMTDPCVTGHGFEEGWRVGSMQGGIERDWLASPECVYFVRINLLFCVMRR